MVWKCLTRCFKSSSGDINFDISESSPVIGILQSKNKDAAKELISSEDQNLAPALGLINTESFSPESLSKRRAISKFFIKCLQEVKLGHRSALLWLKKNVAFEVCKTILDDFGYSGTLLQVIEDKITSLVKIIQSFLDKKIKEKCHKCVRNFFSITYNSLRRLVLVTLVYLDLSLDSSLLFAIVLVLGPSLNDQSLFSTQIANLLLISIVVPAMLTSIDIASNRPFVVVGSEAWVQSKNSDNNESDKQHKLLKTFIVLLFPFVPALVLLSIEKATNKKELLKDKCNKENAKVTIADVEDSEKLSMFINECKLALLTFKRNELSIELVIQLTIHVIMILLSITKYPVESGLQSIFRNNEDKGEGCDTALIFLILSVLWSFRTTALTSIKIKAETKNFLPIFAKVVLGMRYLLVFIIRIGNYVAYFAPYIGLLGIMNHYHAELIHLNPETFNRFNPNSKLIVKVIMLTIYLFDFMCMTFIK